MKSMKDMKVGVGWETNAPLASLHALHGLHGKTVFPKNTLN